MVVHDAISALFHVQIIAYKAYVRSQYNLWSITSMKQWLQTQSLFSMRCLQYVAYKSVVKNLLFALNTISAVFRI